MNTKGIRRKKSSLSEVKVAVIGAPSVGKSALTVRFLTRRYIGEYDHQAGELPPVPKYHARNSVHFIKTRYKNEVLVDGEPILFEILDTCPKSDHELPSQDTLNWADGLLLVYSIIDRKSFEFIRKVTHILTDSDTPLVLVANKSDMIHLRQVSTEEGSSLAQKFDSGFSEVAAAEQVGSVAAAFQDLCRAVLASRRKSKHSLLERMLGTKSNTGRLYARGKSDSALPKDYKV